MYTVSGVKGVWCKRWLMPKVPGVKCAGFWCKSCLVLKVSGVKVALVKKVV